MKALVTGGAGFLARYIVEKLIEQGNEVVSISRGSYPFLNEMGVDSKQGDLRDANFIADACQGCDVVFHVAALAGLWGRYQDFYSINVNGTENVIKACKIAKVSKLVYTSSPSVVFPMGDLNGVNESQPYPETYLAHYPETKAIAEQKVLAANCDSLSTCALRPHLIWGPRDNHILPTIMERASTGRLVQVGNGKNMVDMCYVENAANAHLLAAEHLEAGSACAGKAYFISDDAPVNLWTWISEFLKHMELPPINKKISEKTALRMAGVLEFIHNSLPFLGEPRLTRFTAGNFARSHYFDISAAKEDFNYKATIDNKEGLKRTIDYYIKSRTS